MARMILIICGILFMFSIFTVQAAGTGESEKVKQKGAPDKGKDRPVEIKSVKEHFLVEIELSDNGLKVISKTLVPSAMPKQRMKNIRYPWSYRLFDLSGKEIYSGGMEDPFEVRGEFQNPRDPDKIDSYHFKRKGPVRFTVRIPAVTMSHRLEIRKLKPSGLRVLKPGKSDYIVVGTVLVDIGGIK
ncbi:MAG: hypothetical protein GXP49_11825 [Deltaproteobacteria bacterium]|nr:hypothetical protein [Deltaproteobacteria bacterium]